MFSKESTDEITAAARDAGIEAAALLAVAQIESGGTAYAVVDGRKEPLIRFEGHYFDRRLTGAKQELARQAGLADPAAGAVTNPPSQAARWAMMTRAAAIDRKAAYESTSWGLGQVMGAHWAWLGYRDVDALVAEARDGVAGQVRLMVRFIDKSGLAAALSTHDWAAFARGYNGPGYAGSGYDARLRAAYGRAGGAGMEILRRGSSGDAVAELQQDLARLGYGVSADGVFGARTQEAVKAFQVAHGLAADGIVGPLTSQAVASTMAGISVDTLWRRWLAWLAGFFATS